MPRRQEPWNSPGHEDRQRQREEARVRALRYAARVAPSRPAMSPDDLPPEMSRPAQPAPQTYRPRPFAGRPISELMADATATEQAPTPSVDLENVRAAIRRFRESYQEVERAYANSLTMPVAVDEEDIAAVRAASRPGPLAGWAPMPSFAISEDMLTKPAPKKPKPKTYDYYPKTLSPGMAWEFEVYDGMVREHIVYRNDTDTEVVIPSIIDGVIMARNQKACRGAGV